MLWINYELYLQKILDASPDNYRALVFLGKSAEGLNQSDHALKAYRQAIDVSPDEILAWQGLNKLYEKYPPTQTKDHTEVLEKLVKLTTRYLLPFYASCDSDWFLSTIKMVSNVYHLFYFNCICFFSLLTAMIRRRRKVSTSWHYTLWLATIMMKRYVFCCISSDFIIGISFRAVYTLQLDSFSPHTL